MIRVVFFEKNNFWDSLHARLNSHYEAWNYKQKKHIKVKNIGNLYRKNLQLKDVC